MVLPQGSLNTARYFHTATLLPNGKVLVIGGFSEDIGVGDHTDSTELYDPATNTWSAAGSLITPRFRHTATLLFNGKVLVVGGYNDYGNQLDSVSASAEIYDPTTDNWSAAGDLSTKHVEHTATLLTNGKVLVAGGCYTSPDYQSLYVDSSELYDPATNSWTIVGSLITARHNHVATLLATVWCLCQEDTITIMEASLPLRSCTIRQPTIGLTQEV